MPSLTHNGINLSYKDAGKGHSVLCIHGGMADSSHFEDQIDFFKSSHRIVSVDLRGHGESDKPQDGYTISTFADDCVWLAQELGLTQPLVVGHSMGGLIALDIASRYPEFTSAIVILDSPIIPPPAFAEALKPFVESLRIPQYHDSIRMFLNPFIGFTDNPERRQNLLNQLSSVPQHVVAAELESYLEFDSDKAASQCKVPVLYISSGPNFSDLTRFRELCPQLVTGQTVGAGHYHQLEVPEQINAMIERFMALYLPVQPS
jgi:pimeloyl-ACP methyl ester carboxylesterase